MVKRDRDVFHGDFLAASVKADSHRGANAQADEQEIVRAGRRVASTERRRLIRAQLMFAADNFLQKSFGVAANNHVRRGGMFGIRLDRRRYVHASSINKTPEGGR